MTNKHYNNRPDSRQPSGRFAGIMRVMFLRRPWIAPLTLAAMTLLVWGAINALPAREPEVRIRVVQETVEVTVYVTRLVTATPLPTVTRTPTPIRTRSPRQAIRDYRRSVLDVNDTMLAALDTLVKLTKDSDPGSNAWRRDVREQVQVVRDADEAMAAIEPPPEAIEVHALWVDGTHDYALAVDGLDAYLDDRDFEALERSLPFMETGQDKLIRAIEGTDALMSD